MKSIEAILNFVSSIAVQVRKTCDIDIVLIGGYAVIAHGVARTTTESQEEKKKTDELVALIRRDKNLTALTKMGKNKPETEEDKNLLL